MEILNMLNPKNTVSFSRPVAHALGLNAAVVYSALIAKQVYYAQHDMLDEEGFFYSTVADLQESTSMGKDKQLTAIKVLTEAGLVECRKRGLPARRCFRVRDDAQILYGYLELGEQEMTELNPIAQKRNEKAPTSCTENGQQVGGFSDNKSEENTPYTLNPYINKSKANNPNQSIQSCADEIDEIDEADNQSEIISADTRSEYHEVICDNIGYECFEEKTKVDELVEIMLDVICSGKETVRVNGGDIPREVVTSRFLKLGPEHISYVIAALEKNTTGIRNIRAYLITALYNAPTTIDSYYTALVNHDMHSRGRMQ
ncbi:MAG: DUF6017 domain-containing protein [Oscillospiraceae bacterium]